MENFFYFIVILIFLSLLGRIWDLQNKLIVQNKKIIKLLEEKQ